MTNKQMEQMMFDLKKSIIEEIHHIWLQDVIDSIKKDLKDEIDELSKQLIEVSMYVSDELDESE